MAIYLHCEEEEENVEQELANVASQFRVYFELDGASLPLWKLLEVLVDPLVTIVSTELYQELSLFEDLCTIEED